VPKSADETKRAQMADIDAERARLRRLLRAADPATLAARPPNGDWSIIENVRHLLFAERLHLGGFVPGKVEWSPLGITGMKAKKFAVVGTAERPTLDEVLAAWDAIHRATRNAMKPASRLEVEKALWRNHRHLRTHKERIERLLHRTRA
jgi:hypothetical protein